MIFIMLCFLLLLYFMQFWRVDFAVVYKFESITVYIHCCWLLCCLSLMLLCLLISIYLMLFWEVYVAVVDYFMSVTTGADFYGFNWSDAIVIDSFNGCFCVHWLFLCEPKRCSFFSVILEVICCCFWPFCICLDVSAFFILI